MGKEKALKIITYLRNTLDLLEGHQSKAPPPTIKIDGAPALTFATSFPGVSEASEGWVSTKSVFNKNAKVYLRDDDIRRDNRPDGLKQKLYVALKLAQCKMIPPGEIWQGDLLWTKGDAKERDEWVYVKPNTLAYAAKKGSDLAEAMISKDIGLVFHTRYKGDIRHPIQSNDVRVEELQNIPDWAFIIDARLPNGGGKTSFTNEESAAIEKWIDDIEADIKTLVEHPNYEALCNNTDFIQFTLMTLQNQKVDAGEDLNPDTFLKDLHQWINKRGGRDYSKLGKLKTSAGRDKSRDKIKLSIRELHNIIEENSDLIIQMATLIREISDIKTEFINKMEQATQFMTFVEKRDGSFNASSGEGFVVSDIDGSFVKLVDRKTFSRNNRSPDVVKGFEHPETKLTESNEEDDLNEKIEDFKNNLDESPPSSHINKGSSINEIETDEIEDSIDEIIKEVVSEEDPDYNDDDDEYELLSENISIVKRFLREARITNTDEVSSKATKLESIEKAVINKISKEGLAVKYFKIDSYGGGKITYRWSNAKIKPGSDWTIVPQTLEVQKVISKITTPVSKKKEIEVPNNSSNKNQVSSRSLNKNEGGNELSDLANILGEKMKKDNLKFKFSLGKQNQLKFSQIKDNKPNSNSSFTNEVINVLKNILEENHKKGKFLNCKIEKSSLRANASDIFFYKLENDELKFIFHSSGSVIENGAEKVVNETDIQEALTAYIFGEVIHGNIKKEDLGDNKKILNLISYQNLKIVLNDSFNNEEEWLTFMSPKKTREEKKETLKNFENLIEFNNKGKEWARYYYQLIKELTTGSLLTKISECYKLTEPIKWKEYDVYHPNLAKGPEHLYLQQQFGSIQDGYFKDTINPTDILLYKRDKENTTFSNLSKVFNYVRTNNKEGNNYRKIWNKLTEDLDIIGISLKKNTKTNLHVSRVYPVGSSIKFDPEKIVCFRFADEIDGKNNWNLWTVKEIGEPIESFKNNSSTGVNIKISTNENHIKMEEITMAIRTSGGNDKIKDGMTVGLNLSAGGEAQLGRASDALEAMIPENTILTYYISKGWKSIADNLLNSLENLNGNGYRNLLYQISKLLAFGCKYGLAKVDQNGKIIKNINDPDNAMLAVDYIKIY
jgi:hypothetical protein